MEIKGGDFTEMERAELRRYQERENKRQWMRIEKHIYMCGFNSLELVEEGGVVIRDGWGGVCRRWNLCERKCLLHDEHAY